MGIKLDQNWIMEGWIIIELKKMRLELDYQRWDYNWIRELWDQNWIKENWMRTGLDLIEIEKARLEPELRKWDKNWIEKLGLKPNSRLCD